MKNILLLFKSVHLVIKAGKLCSQNNIACHIVPVPREISTECGMAIKIGKQNKDKIIKILTGNGIEYRCYEK